MTAHPRTCHRCTSRLHPALKQGNCRLQRGLAAVDVSASVGATGTRCRWTGRSTTHPHKNSPTCFGGRSSRQGKHLLFSCVITVTKLNLLRPFGLRSSEAQIPQIVVNVRNWRKTMETSELMILRHTQEVTGSSPVAPTINLCLQRVVRTRRSAIPP
jgi:hypothetical protein